MLELCFLLTLLGFVTGFLMHWHISRKDRRILKAYRQQAKSRQHAAQPVE